MGHLRNHSLLTNTGAAKYGWGLGTVILGLITIGAWGVFPASCLVAAGLILYFGAGDSLSQFSPRGIALQVVYWTLVMIGVGIGVA